MTNDTTPAALRLTKQLGPLPEPALKLTRHPWNCYSAAQMVAERFATAEAAAAAERQRLAEKFMAQADEAHKAGHYAKRDELSAAAGWVLRA